MKTARATACPSAADALYTEITGVVPGGVGPRAGDARANYLAGVRDARERAADLAVPVVAALEARVAKLEAVAETSRELRAAWGASIESGGRSPLTEERRRLVYAAMAWHEALDELKALDAEGGTPR